MGSRGWPHLGRESPRACAETSGAPAAGPAPALVCSAISREIRPNGAGRCGRARRPGGVGAAFAKSCSAAPPPPGSAPRAEGETPAWGLPNAAPSSWTPWPVAPSEACLPPLNWHGAGDVAAGPGMLTSNMPSRAQGCWMRAPRLSGCILLLGAPFPLLFPGLENPLHMLPFPRACPECRVTSSYYIPHKYWVSEADEKQKLVEAFKARTG
uniref:Uncharacterized protein n=1 Tax=Apteryx owenii TaxID=8824 RepID=A0A8B9PCL6_APTOW